MAETSAMVVGLAPGQIYSAKTLLGLKDPLAAQIEEPVRQDLIVSNGGRRRAPGTPSDSSKASSSLISPRGFRQPLHSTVESLWGSASDAASLQRRRKERGLRERRILFGEIDGEKLEKAYKRVAQEQSRIHLYMQKQDVEPQRAPNAVPEVDSTRESIIKQADQEAEAAAAAAAKPEPSGVSVTTLVLNTQTKRLERKGDRETALMQKRQQAIERKKLGTRTEKDTENLCLLWEAFHRGGSNNSGWLRTRDLSWSLQRDERLFEIFGIKRKDHQEETEEIGWKRWLRDVLRSRDEPLPVVRSLRETPEAAYEQRIGVDV